MIPKSSASIRSKRNISQIFQAWKDALARLYRPSSSGEQSQHTRPDNLPSEVFEKTLQYLTLQELWRATHVCQTWRGLIRGNHLFWTHIDLAAFKLKHRIQACDEIMKFAQNHVQSLIIPTQYLGGSSGKAGPEKYFSHTCWDIPKQKATEKWFDGLLRSCPQLCDLSVPSAFTALGRDIPWPRQLKRLELCYPEKNDRPIYEVLIHVPDLEKLVLTSFDVRACRIQPDYPVLLKLKSFKLTPARRSRRSWILPFQNLCLQELAKAAPELERLEIGDFVGGCMAQSHVLEPGLTGMHNLRECIFTDMSGPLDGILRLPHSVEKLVFLTKETFDTGRPYIIRDEPYIPSLPNLKHLEVSRDYVFTRFGRDQPKRLFWTELLQASGCKLQSFAVTTHIRGDNDAGSVPGADIRIPSTLLFLMQGNNSSKLKSVVFRDLHEQPSLRFLNRWFTVWLGEFLERCPVLRRFEWTVLTDEAKSMVRDALCKDEVARRKISSSTSHDPTLSESGAQPLE